MYDLTPHTPYRPLLWPDFILNLQDILPDLTDEPVYVVGGAVRDALLHRPIRDIDLIVADQGIQLARRIANYFKGHFFSLDVERDVGRAFIQTADGSLVIDVAGFRNEDLLSDLHDRDFTLNAMAVNLAGESNLLIDPLDGERDIRAKILRQCNEQSVVHDPLRIVRAVRLSIQFGLRIEPDTLNVIRSNSILIKVVSPERLRDELVKTLALNKVAGAVRVMDAVGIMPILFPEVTALKSISNPHLPALNLFQLTLTTLGYLAQIQAVFSPGRSESSSAFNIGVLVMELDCYRQQIRLHLQKGWPNDRPHTALLALAALMLLSGKSHLEAPFEGYERASASLAEAKGEALRLSHAENVYLAQAMKGVAHVPVMLDDLMLHHFWYEFGDAGVDSCLLSLASYLAKVGSEIDQDAWVAYLDHIRQILQAYFERYDQVVAPRAVIDGNRLIQGLDLQPGPIIGELLKLIREAQVIGQIHTEDEAFHLARTYLNHQS